MPIQAIEGLRRTRCIVAAMLLCLTSAVSADPEVFFGKWGTDKQCAGDLIIPGGTRHAAPFEIGKEWLGHGDVWCRLFWINTGSSQQGTMPLPVRCALCGEDDVRDYRINFQLQDNLLSLIWNQHITNDRLKHCPLCGQHFIAVPLPGCIATSQYSVNESTDPCGFRTAT